MQECKLSKITNSFFFYCVAAGTANVLNQINRNTPSPMSQNGMYTQLPTQEFPILLYYD